MEKKKLSLGLAILPIIVMVVMALMSSTTWKIGMNLPIFFGILTTALIGAYLGFSWGEMQKSLVDGVARALPALFILLIVGLIIGAWISGGIIPTLIYYGLKIISPAVYIPVAALVTGIVAISTGTSFTSIATVGIALMAAGLGMGFPAPLLAGAIISGAYMGDSMSPLSDTTNLASAMTETNLFDVISSLMVSGIPSFGISLVIFYFLGAGHAQGVSVESAEIIEILTGLDANFVISPLLLLVPLVTIILSIKKIPAMPSLVIVATLGALCAVFVQGASLQEILNHMTNGYKSATGIAMVDSLLSRGGMVSMAGTIVLMMLATAIGGILEKLGFLQVMLDSTLKFVKNDGQLVVLAITSSLAIAFATGAQLLANMLPARMFVGEFKARGLKPEALARISATIGGACINFVPWSVPAVYAFGVLGVDPFEFIPYLVFMYVSIIVNIIFGFTGFNMKEEKNKKEKVVS